MIKIVAKKLSDIAEITMGQSPRSEYYNSNEEGMPFLQGNRTFGDKYPNFDTYTTNPTKIANVNDVIMSVRAPVGDLNITPKKICLGRGVCSIHMKNGNQDFLYYLMKYYVKDILNRECGTVFGSVNKNDISSLIVKIPERFEEQKKISSILSVLDDKIELNKKINRNLEAQAQAIFKSWFIDFEPFGGKMPADWKQGYLSDVLSTIESGSRPKGGSELSGVPSIGAENIDGIGHYDYTKEKYINRNFFQNLRHGKVNSGDVLLYKDGAYVGKVSMALNGFPHKICAVNEHVFILRTNECLPSQSYLYLFLTQRSIRNKISTLGSAKAAQPGINQGDIKGIALTIPNQKMIQTFEKATSSIFNMIVQNSIQSRCLAQLRDTLLPKLMSGEIDISDVAV